MANENKLLKAWHASPYDFERFGPMRDVSGKGQGAAAYGRGAAYVAESPKVSGPGESNYMLEFSEHPAAMGKGGWTIPDDLGGPADRLTLDESYEDNAHPDNLEDGSDWVNHYLSQSHHDPGALNALLKEVRNEGPASLHHLTDFMNHESDFVIDASEGGHSPQYDTSHAQLVRDYLNGFKKRGSEFTPETYYQHIVEPGTGGPFSYEVNVHLKPETMLDWDAPMSEHHPEAHDKIFKVHHDSLPKDPHVPDDPEYYKGGNWWQSKRGMDVYSTLTRQLGSDFAASEALFNAGIHGIRYKDGASREPQPVFHFEGKPVDHTSATKEELEDEDAMMSKDIGSRVSNDWRLKGLSTKGLKRWFETHRDMNEVFMKEAADNPNMDKAEAAARFDEFSKAVDWLNRHEGRYELKYPKPTYNYVIFHPDFVEAVAQYNIKGEKVKDMGPGVHLKTVDHDPFKGEG